MYEYVCVVYVCVCSVCVWSHLQHRPEPVGLRLAVRVEEDEHVADGVARARQPRPRQPHATSHTSFTNTTETTSHLT